MVKNINKDVSLSESVTEKRKSLNKNKSKNKNVINQKQKQNQNQNKIKSKLKIINQITTPNKPLELPKPSLLLQIPLNGNAQNIFWVLPYETNNKLKISVHWPGILVDINEVLKKNLDLPKKPEIKDHSNISFELVQLFGIYKLVWIISDSKYLLPFDRYLVQRCARSRSKFFKKAVDQAIAYRKNKILPKEMKLLQPIQYSNHSNYLRDNNHTKSKDDDIIYSSFSLPSPLPSPLESPTSSPSTSLTKTINYNFRELKYENKSLDSSPLNNKINHSQNNKNSKSFFTSILTNINNNNNNDNNDNNNNDNDNDNDSINKNENNNNNYEFIQNKISSTSMTKEDENVLISSSSHSNKTSISSNNNTINNPMYLLLEAVKSVNK